MIYFVQLQKDIQNIAESQATIAHLAMKSWNLFPKLRFLDTPPIFIYINYRGLPMKPLHREACLIYVSRVTIKNLKESKWKEISPTEYKMSSD